MLVEYTHPDEKLHSIYLTLSSERHEAVHVAQVAIINRDYPSYFGASRKYREYNDIISEYFGNNDTESEAFPSYTIRQYFDDLQAEYESSHPVVVFSDGSTIADDVDVPF